ncbi:MAG TPA: HAMP domain-containing sensor histidine kinase [Pseudonocardiaceae bacterium]|nr:HAMP domain-containing sensor histidine kinase [Pseudonocardiaceae bacterium]
MRTRLLAVVTSLVVLVVIGLGAPLALSVAGSESQQLFLDRLTDTESFASMAQQSLSSGDFTTLGHELTRYQEVYGIQAAVVDTSERLRAHSATSIELTDPDVHAAVQAALAGQSPHRESTLLPWNDTRLVVAEPVLLGGELRGAAVTVSGTTHVRDVILGWWGALGGGAIVAIALAVLAALPVVRWVLRPLRRLDDATAQLGAAVVKGEDVDPAGIRGGPPELRRLSESFDRLATTVTMTLAAQRAFVADASHQLRNPLTALRLRLGNLSGHLYPEAEEHQAAAVAEADRLGRILDELLAMARAESGAVEPVEVDVDQVVKQRVSSWHAVATHRNVSIVLAGEPGGAALAPPRGLEAILDALLENALKFTGQSTLVEVEVRRQDGPDGSNGTVAVSVRDHGPGLKPEELARATDRFWRSREHQNVHGTGLGLAIVRRIVERVSGTVEVSTPEGGGLLVRIELPAVG